MKRDRILFELATWQGIYVPSFYETEIDSMTQLEVVTSPKPEFDGAIPNKVERFFAYQHEKDNLALSFGVVEDRYNYGNIGAAKLDISYQF